jgi:hypothetical protein
MKIWSARLAWRLGSSRSIFEGEPAMLAIFTRRFMTYLMLGLAALLALLPLATPAEAGWRSLTGQLPAYTGISFKISPDSRYAVFTADIEVDGRTELYSVPITGTTPLKLNPLLVAGGRVYGFEITPDSQYVIYTAKQEAGESRRDLYRVPLTGGQAVKLNVGPKAGRHVRSFKIDPDNVHVVYQAEQQAEGQIALFSVPIAGGTAGQLNPPLVAGGDINDFAIDPFGNRVVYLANQEVVNRLELYGVPIVGGPAVELNPPGSEVNDFALNPQAQVVVFRARLNNVYALYMNTTGGGLLTPLYQPLASNEQVSGFRISPDGSRVVYNVATFINDSGNLYSVSIGGGASTPLTIPAEPGYGVPYYEFDITADSRRVVYYYQKNAMASPVYESVALTGDNRARLHEQGAGGEYAHIPVLSPNGRWLVYNTDPSFQLYAIPTEGGAPIPLGVGSFPNITPDSSRVIFSNSYNLYSAPIAGGEAANLSRAEGDQAGFGDALIISPDGRWIAFEVRYKTGNKELRVSDGAEAQPAPPRVNPVYLPIIVR